MKIFSVLSLVVVSLGIAACGSKNTSVLNADTSGIIGGQRAEDSSPVLGSTVSLLMGTFKPSSFCSGTLISKNLVLTATHCVRAVSGSQMSVYFGKDLPKTMSAPGIVPVKATKTHPDYRWGTSPITNTMTGYNDVGLVVLDGELPVGAHPVPVLNPTTLPNGMPLLLAGYGLVQEVPFGIEAEGLSYVTVPLAKTFEGIIVTDQNKAMGACAGDSGGPAYLTTEQGLVVLGITRGPHAGAPDCRHFGEYTNATMYKDFILNSADELGAERPVFVDAPITAN